MKLAELKERLTSGVQSIPLYGLMIGAVLVVVFLFFAWYCRLVPISWILIWGGLCLFSLVLSAHFFKEKSYFSIAGWVFLAASVAISAFQIYEDSGIRSTLSETAAPLVPEQDKFSFYSSKEDRLRNLDSLNKKKLGLMSGRNDVLNEKVLSLLKEKNVEPEISYYATLQELYNALRSQKVSAIGLNGYDMELLDLLNVMQTGNFLSSTGSFYKELSLIDSFDLEGQPLEGNPSLSVRHTPFTVLSKVYANAEEQRVYSLQLSAVNPITRQITTVLIPRDYWVNYACEKSGACTVGSDKISLADYISEKQSIEVVEQLLGVDVDFVVDVEVSILLDALALDYVEIENYGPVEFKDSFFDAGTMKLRAEKAKLFAQILNQQDQSSRLFQYNSYEVLKAFLEKDLSSLYSRGLLAKILSDSVRSDLSYDQLCDLIEIFLINQEKYELEEVELQGRDAYFFSGMLTDYSYVIIPDQQSINQISQLLQFRLTQSDASQEVPVSVEPYTPYTLPEEVPAEEPVQEEIPEEEPEPEPEPEETYDPYSDPYYDPYGLYGYYGYNPYAYYGGYYGGYYG